MDVGNTIADNTFVVFHTIFQRYIVQGLQVCLYCFVIELTEWAFISTGLRAQPLVAHDENMVGRFKANGCMGTEQRRMTAQQA